MPIKGGRSTARERKFVEAFVASGGDRAYAEKQAGYAPNGGYQVLNRPDVQQMIAQRQRAMLHEVAFIASNQARDMLLSKSTSPKDRIALIKEAWKYTHGAEGAMQIEKDPSEMSPEELEAVTRPLLEERKRILDRLKDVTPIEEASSPFD